MKTVISAVSIAILATLTAQASAETWSPTGTIAIQSINPATGAADTLEVSKGITLNCTMAGSAVVNPADQSDASVGSLGLSSGFPFLCNTISFTNLPYNLEGNADGTATLENVVVQAVTGDCAGDLTGDFDQSTGYLTFNNATIPSTSGGNDCEVNGTVDTNPQASYTNP